MVMQCQAVATARAAAINIPRDVGASTTGSYGVRACSGTVGTRGAAMIDHSGVVVSDFEKSKAFYRAALQPIGYEMLMEFPAAVTGHADVAGFGEQPKADFWIARGPANRPAIQIAFRVR